MAIFKSCHTSPIDSPLSLSSIVPLSQSRRTKHTKSSLDAGLEASTMSRKPLVLLDEGLGTIKKAVAKLKRILEENEDNAFSFKFEGETQVNLYTLIYDICNQRPPHQYQQELYDGYREILEDYISDTVLPSIKAKKQHSGGESMLAEIVKRWAKYKVMVKWLRHLFFYLEIFFIPRWSLSTLKEVGLASFRDLVYTAIKDESRHIVVSLIDQERSEEQQIDRFLLKDVRDFYVAMGDAVNSIEFYEKDLEPYILEDAAEFYHLQASNLILHNSCPEYMIKAEQWLELEKERALNYMHDSTEPKLLERVRQELLSAHIDQLLEKDTGCRTLLRDDNVEELSRIYRLFSKVEKGLELVSRIFREHVIGEGLGLIEQAEDAAEDGDWKPFVPKSIELHDKYMARVINCFENHSSFHKALKEAFESFFDKKIAGSITAELLAAFTDNILQKGGEDDEVVEANLEKTVKLLAYISDKDLFSEFCRKKLARRLLFDRSNSFDHEKHFLGILKQHYGTQFTSKMECMLNDLILSKENHKDFNGYLTENSQTNLTTSFTVTLLTTGKWPTYKPCELNLPSEMVKCVESYTKYYQATTTRRKLAWIHSMGSCTLTGMFANKTMELVVTPYQACVLLLFNDSDRLSYSEIMMQLHLEDDDVTRVLHSLSCAKYKILKKVPSTNSISQNDYFEFNSNFKDRLRRIKVPLPLVEEKKKAIQDTKRNRKCSIEACIVRIMKSRKVLTYQQLMLECIEQLSRTFKPEVKMIKPIIEDLISREFLERDAKNFNIFKYLA